MRRVVGLCTLLCAACAPVFSDDVTVVTAPRLLAAIAEPAEVRPRASVAIEAVTAPDGARVYAGDTPFRFSFCTVPATLGDPRPVADDCITEPGLALDVDATGVSAHGIVPADACARFGPEPPPGDVRPRDPDGTGGFYQPVRIEALGERWIQLLRIRCAFANAPVAVSRELQEAYVPNVNPSAPALEVSHDGAWEALESLQPGERATVRATWPAENREAYVSLSPAADRVETRFEAMSVSWFTTAGKLARSTTSREESDPANAVENTITAPDSTPDEGRFTVWTVLRDSRGGVAVALRRVTLNDSGP